MTRGCLQKIKHNVMRMVEKYGAEQTKFLLHSHDRIILEETVTGNAAVAVNLARSSSNRTPSRTESETQAQAAGGIVPSDRGGGVDEGDGLLKPLSLRGVFEAQIRQTRDTNDVERPHSRATTRIVNVDADGAALISIANAADAAVRPQTAESLPSGGAKAVLHPLDAATLAATRSPSPSHMRPMDALQQQRAALPPPPAQRHGYVHVTQRTLKAATGVRVRGAAMLPSVDVPNIPVPAAVRRVFERADAESGGGATPPLS